MNSSFDILIKFLTNERVIDKFINNLELASSDSLPYHVWMHFLFIKPDITLDQKIARAFPWGSTPEGRDYWITVNSKYISFINTYNHERSRK